MKKFKINELLKKIIMINSNIKNEDKELLIENINYEKVTSLEALKIIEGILNYGVLLTKEQLKSLPKFDCKKLNTALHLIIEYYKVMDDESLERALDSMLSINVDSTDGGYYKEDSMAPLSAVNDILEDYASGSRPLDSKEYDLSDNEISLYNVKVNYANKEMIRDFERTVFS